MVHVKKGELTQEEKELLEVIGKGVGAGLRRRRCRSGQGARLSPGGAPAPANPGLRFCAVGSAGPGNTVFPLVWDQLRGQRGGEGEALLRRERRLPNSSSKSAVGKVHIFRPHLGL